MLLLLLTQANGLTESSRFKHILFAAIEYYYKHIMYNYVFITSLILVSPPYVMTVHSSKI